MRKEKQQQEQNRKRKIGWKKRETWGRNRRAWYLGQTGLREASCLRLRNPWNKCLKIPIVETPNENPILLSFKKTCSSMNTNNPFLLVCQRTRAAFIVNVNTHVWGEWCPSRTLGPKPPAFVHPHHCLQKTSLTCCLYVLIPLWSSWCWSPIVCMRTRVPALPSKLEKLSQAPGWFLNTFVRCENQLLRTPWIFLQVARAASVTNLVWQ